MMHNATGGAGNDHINHHKIDPHTPEKPIIRDTGKYDRIAAYIKNNSRGSRTCPSTKSAHQPPACAGN
ncbi:MAG: hypothetical protein A2519_15190 [Candidatus Raymondbacteria bacterium RIFOXYD12_FULL_49_13]|uniref:Uncharacterized protein n=1 Tax=Candidatus Raymondbacteria bacterium RIFOXYD12_FULL_49_13 TaxID=1817890 RepID=A0A1F7F9Y0_UNCRA|nr:MAG: hypothetical protein A2519_15190 [Candidatus Raymondbacteria bacterium RIFOXYD12_FULL_49_13]